MEASRIHVERFGQTTTGSTDGKASGIALHVETGGREHRLETGVGERLLDSMERAGLKPLSGCRAGACGACKCKVTEGKVKLHDNLVLSDAELAEGWTLACQAEADSSTLKIRL
jgi:3-ketosteroid 9alpha-monooxygenase subunit B